jgi:hypothetical protein
LQEHLVGDTNKMPWLPFGAVTFVLLIACANVAKPAAGEFCCTSDEMAIERRWVHRVGV